MSLRRIFVIGLAAAGIALIPGPRAWASVTLQVIPVEGGNQFDLDFGTARSLGLNGEPEADVVVRQLRIIVTSTSSAQYQIFQGVDGSWVNLEEEPLILGAVRFFISGVKTDGIVRFPNPAPLSLGEQEIFLSNASGGSEEFLVTYTVRVPVGQRAGRYRTRLTFRVVSQ